MFKPISSSDFEEVPKVEKTSMFGRLGSFFEESRKSISDAAISLGNKVSDLNIGDKLKKAGNKTLDVMKNAGEKISDKGKELIVKQIYLLIRNQISLNQLQVKPKTEYRL